MHAGHTTKAILHGSTRRISFTDACFSDFAEVDSTATASSFSFELPALRIFLPLPSYLQKGASIRGYPAGYGKYREYLLHWTWPGNMGIKRNSVGDILTTQALTWIFNDLYRIACVVIIIILIIHSFLLLLLLSLRTGQTQCQCQLWRTPHYITDVSRGFTTQDVIVTCRDLGKVSFERAVGCFGTSQLERATRIGVARSLLVLAVSK